MTYTPFSGDLSVGDSIKQSWGQKVQDNITDHEARLVSIGGNVDYLMEVNVSPTGSDTTGDGSSSAPYQTIQKAIDSLQGATILSTGGAQIQLADGTYNMTSPLDISFLRKLSIIGNLTDSSLVQLHFDLSGYTDPTPHESKGVTGCLSINMSQVKLDGFEIHTDAQNSATPYYECIAVNSSNLSLGDVGLFTSDNQGILASKSYVSTELNKTLYGTVFNGIDLQHASVLGTIDNGNINLTASSSGSGVGIKSDLSSKYNSLSFQTVTLTNFGFEESPDFESPYVFKADSAINSLTLLGSVPIDNSISYYEIDSDTVTANTSSGKVGGSNGHAVYIPKKNQFTLTSCRWQAALAERNNNPSDGTQYTLSEASHSSVHVHLYIKFNFTNNTLEIYADGNGATSSGRYIAATCMIKCVK